MGLAENLVALKQMRQRNKERRSSVLGTILTLSREREKEALPAIDAGASMLNPSRALEQLTRSGGGGGGNPTAAVANTMSGKRGKSGLDSSFEQAVQRLIKDHPGVRINSGYRSPQRQAQLYAQAIKKYGSEKAARKWVAPPGRSNHGRGTAVDLGFSNAKVRQQVHANARKYGLHFPLAHENWHIEPIRARKR